MRYGTGLVLVLSIVLTLTAGNRSPASAQELRGTLRDVSTGRPLPFGTIELISGDETVAARTVSGEDGTFVISPARAASFSVRAWRIDADTVIDGPIELDDGEVRDLDFLLSVTAFELDQLDVTVSGAPRLEVVGFYQREQVTTGVFMTRKQIDEGLRMRTTDVLERVPEVHVESRLTPGSPPVHLR